MEELLSGYARLYQLEEESFVHGKGRHKTVQQRRYEQLGGCKQKLEAYREKLTICGKERNSYAKTDPCATFMQLKKDYMGNGNYCPLTTFRLAWRMSILPWRT